QLSTLRYNKGSARPRADYGPAPVSRSAKLSRLPLPLRLLSTSHSSFQPLHQILRLAHPAASNRSASHGAAALSAILTLHACSQSAANSAATLSQPKRVRTVAAACAPSVRASASSLSTRTHAAAN